MHVEDLPFILTIPRPVGIATLYRPLLATMINWNMW